MNARTQGFEVSFETQYVSTQMDPETLQAERQNRAKVIVNFSSANGAADGGGHLRLSKLSPDYLQLPPTGSNASASDRRRASSVTETVLYPCAGIAGTVLRYRISHCI